jgi:hypothetical protein
MISSTPAASYRPRWTWIIDGRVEDVTWSSTGPFGAFIQQEPNEGETATERTEIRFLVDRDNL